MWEDETHLPTWPFPALRSSAHPLVTRRITRRFAIQLNKIVGAEISRDGGEPTSCYVYVADISECHVVPKAVSDLLLPLRELIGSMDAIETCPQIELACGDGVTALVLRHLEPLSTGDLAKLREFAAARARMGSRPRRVRSIM